MTCDVSPVAMFFVKPSLKKWKHPKKWKKFKWKYSRKWKGVMAYDVSPRWRSWFLLLLFKVVRISLSVWIPFHSCISSPMTQRGESIPSSVEARPKRFFHLLQRQWDNYRHPKSGSLCCHSWFIEIIDWWKALKSTFSSSDCGWQRTARRPLVPVLLVRKVLAPHGACGTCCGTRGSWSPLWNDLLAFQLGPWVGKKKFPKIPYIMQHGFWSPGMRCICRIC